MTVLSHMKPVPKWYTDYYTSLDANPALLHPHHHANASNEENKATLHEGTSTESNAASDQIYHILIISSHLTKDPNQAIEKVRIVGTYDSLPLSKAGAHRALFDAAYESDFFKAYGIDRAFFRAHSVPEAKRHDLVVYAVAQDDTTFEVRIQTTTNDAHWRHEFEDGRITKALYYVVQTTIDFSDAAEGSVGGSKLHCIRDVYDNYLDARKKAASVLLDVDRGTSRDSYACYSEAGADELDCGYGENVIVYAVGENGENYAVSVVQGQVLESVRLMEASMKIR